MRIAVCAALLVTSGILVAQQQPGYSGPSVMSRPGGPANLRAAADLAFRPRVSVTGIYETGLVGVSVDESGNPPDVASPGLMTELGAYVYKVRRRTIVGLDYEGDYRHYSQRRYYNGWNQIATFGVDHQPSRRIKLGFRQIAASFARGFVSVIQEAPFFRPGSVQTPAHAPGDELFDNRTDHLSSIGDVTYIVSPRMSFNTSGGGFIVRRRSAALFGVSGAIAGGDLAYRVSRHSTIGLNYLFLKYGYTQSFGGADVHSLGLNYATSLSRRWELGLLASALRVETEAVRQVQIDPAVAAIIGTSTGIEAFHSRRYVPGGGVRLSRRDRRTSFLISFVQGVSPGNGLYLTSRQRIADASVSYTGMRRWTFSISGGYRTLDSVGTDLGSYRSVAASAQVGRSLGNSGFHLTGRWQVRKYETDLFGLRNRTQTLSSIGLMFSPGDVPVSIW
jgi:hypothetical protein